MIALLALLLCGTEPPVVLPDGFLLVAHRGVVTDALPENSLGSLEATIARGYTHIEVDIRATKDGRAVCLHDPSLWRAAGDKRLVESVTFAELREIAPVETVPDFDTFCARCAGRIALMPDVKGCAPERREAYTRDIAESLQRHGLAESAILIGKADQVEGVRGLARFPWRKADEGAAKSDDPGKHYFAFGHADDFDQVAVEGFQAMGVQVIVSINTLHYPRKEALERGKADIRRMVALGVDGLQIDSVYDDILFGAEK